MRRTFIASLSVFARSTTDSKKHTEQAAMTSTESATAGDKNDEKSLKYPQYFDLDTSANFEKPINTTVTGDVPKWLKGSLYRNGSGLYKMGDTSWKHSFDGFAVLHRWTIQDGQVTYLSKILDSDHYKKSVKFNRLVGTNFGSNFPDPCKSIFRKFFSYFLPSPPGKSDNTAVNLVEFGDRLFAMTETSIINELKPDTVQKKDQIDMSKVLALHMGTAHPHMEKDGSMVYYGTHMNFNRAYNFVKVPPPKNEGSPFKNAKIIASVPSRWKMNISYTHSFGMTENYFVHFEQPLSMNLPKMMTLNMRGDSIADCFVSYDDEPIQIHVVDKKTGKDIPIRFEAPHGFTFHFVNCYEDSGHIVCDVCLFPGGNIVKQLYVESIVRRQLNQELDQSVYARFVLPLELNAAQEGKNLVTLPNTTATAVLKKGTKNVVELKSETMYDVLFELPRINYDFNARKHRYVYGTSVFSIKTRRLMKFDVKEKTMTEWPAGEHHQPGEPVFIPRPGATEEDDGVILCPVLAYTTDHPSFLVILDASSFTELARATVPADIKMNYSFHGTFVNKVF